MPQENQKTITVRKDVYFVAEKKAKKQKKSVAKWVSELIMAQPQSPIIVASEQPKEAR